MNKAGQLSITQLIGEAARTRKDADGLLCPSWFVKILEFNAIPEWDESLLILRNAAVCISDGLDDFQRTFSYSLIQSRFEFADSRLTECGRFVTNIIGD